MIYTENETEADNEEQGRIITGEEYIALLRNRPDIFEVEREKSLKILIPVMILLGVMVSSYVTWVFEIGYFNAGFTERSMAAQQVTLSDQEIDLSQPEDEPEPQPAVKSTPTETLKPSATNAQSSGNNRGGDPSVVVTNSGVIGVLTGAITGASVAGADIFGKGGYTAGVDALLGGVGGLATSSSQRGRRGVGSIGSGNGIIAGNGTGNSGGVGNLDNLMGDRGGRSIGGKRRRLALESPSEVASSKLSGGRQRNTIIRVVRQNLAALRYAFNKRLREKSDLGGKVTVQWAIDEFGNVLFVKVVDATIDDEEFIAAVVKKIKLWKFGKIDKPGDVTEVTYPFIFSS